MSELDDQILSDAVEAINAGRPYRSPFSENEVKKAPPHDVSEHDVSENPVPSNEVEELGRVTNQAGEIIKGNGAIRRY